MHMPETQALQSHPRSGVMLASASTDHDGIHYGFSFYFLFFYVLNLTVFE